MRAGSDFVCECSIDKTKFTLLNKNSFSSSFCQPITLYIEGELKLNLYRISVWLAATAGLRCFVQLASNMFVVVHWLTRDCRILGSTKQ